jgi:hypothetical protein
MEQVPGQGAREVEPEARRGVRQFAFRERRDALLERAQLGGTARAPTQVGGETARAEASRIAASVQWDTRQTRAGAGRPGCATPRPNRC